MEHRGAHPTGVATDPASLVALSLRIGCVLLQLLEPHLLRGIRNSSSRQNSTGFQCKTDRRSRALLSGSRDGAELGDGGRIENALHHDHTVQIELKRLVGVHLAPVRWQARALAARGCTAEEGQGKWFELVRTARRDARSSGKALATQVLVPTTSSVLQLYS